MGNYENLKICIGNYTQINGETNKLKEHNVINVCIVTTIITLPSTTTGTSVIGTSLPTILSITSTKATEGKNTVGLGNKSPSSLLSVGGHGRELKRIIRETYMS